jgi:hypothetical protein
METAAEPSVFFGDLDRRKKNPAAKRLTSSPPDGCLFFVLRRERLR